MKNRLFSVFLFALLLIVNLSTLTDAQRCGIKCGEERWKVKTLTDKTVKNVDFEPVTKTVNWLTKRERPARLPDTTRLIGIETMTFKVRGLVIAHNLERNDEDFHVVIADPNNKNKTMIIEFPDAKCSGVCSSKFLAQIQQARADFVSQIGQPKRNKFTVLDQPILVEVVGVGFFDRMHGQRGRALPSGVELHPVLEFRVIQ